jgi:hypothetical protein
MALAAKARLCNNKSERRPHYLILSNKKSLSVYEKFLKFNNYL